MAGGPRFTIIVPVYREQANIAACLDALDSLERIEEAEVIVVEDAYPEGEEPAPGEGGAPAPKTSAKLREMVVARDGCRCRCCGSTSRSRVNACSRKPTP